MSHKTIKTHSGQTKVVHLKHKRDVHDHRDKLLKASASDPLHASPPCVDNSPFCPPVQDQQSVGSCTAHMATCLVEYNDIKFGKVPGFTWLSRLAQYWWTRELEGSTGEDSGASIRNAIKAMNKRGTLPEAQWGYDLSKLLEAPPKPLVTSAAKHEITDYYRITDGDLDTLKSALATGYLVGFGFVCYPGLSSDETASTGILPMPDLANEESDGGHAVVLVGYDDREETFLVRNSWGNSWGLPTQPGYFKMPYAYIANAKLANDFWVVRSVLE